MTTSTNIDMQARDPSADWIDDLLLRDAHDHADYISDGGFTARVIEQLPPAGVLPAWRRPFVMLLWAVAGVLLAVSLPGLAYDVARTAYTPSPGSTVGTSPRFAVGKPMVRPRFAPSMTVPAMRYGRLSSSAAVATSPATSAARTRLLDTGSPPNT
jgi:hypothetical protein